jgi:hypothetical protein
MSINAHLRRVLQDSCLSPADTGARTGSSVEQETERALLKSEVDLSKQEMSKIKLFLQERDAWKNSKEKAVAQHGHPPRMLYPLQTNDNTQDKMNAVKLIEFELQSLRRKTDDLKKSNQLLVGEVRQISVWFWVLASIFRSTLL